MSHKMNTVFSGDMEQKKYIVTGGAGFIGSHIVDALIARGDSVVVIDDLSSGNIENINKKAVFHRVDIRDVDALRKVFDQSVQGIFHCAAIVSVQYSIEHPEETEMINVEGTRNVLKVASEKGVIRVIFCSSAAVYGETTETAVNESVKANPQSPYGKDKLEGEIECIRYAKDTNLETVILRYFNVFGTRQRGDSSYAGVIARFIELRNESKPLTIFGDGSQTRDFVNVKDVVSANLKAMDTSSISGEVINIGSGKATSVKEIAKIISSTVLFAPARKEVKNSLADITKAKSTLHWSPIVSLKEGIGDLLVL